MRTDKRHIEADDEMRRLCQLADRLASAGKHDRASALRREAASLRAAESQRFRALSNARLQAQLLTLRLDGLRRVQQPDLPFDEFLHACADPAVDELRRQLEREQSRIAILEAASA